MLLGFIIMATGCWTSLSTNLRDAQVKPGVKELKYSRVIEAPQFLEAMRKVGITTVREFRIKPGNLLSIRIGNEPEVGGLYTVDPSGSIDFPYVGLLVVGEKTIKEVRDELRARLEKFYNMPDVTVNIAGGISVDRPTGLRAYVLSDAGSSPVNLNGTENLIDLITATGSFSDATAVDLIAVYKPPKEGDTKGTVVLCNLMKLLSEGDHRQNIPIEHQDIVYVPIRHNTILEEFVESMSIISRILTLPAQVEGGVRYWFRNPRTSVVGRSRREGELYSNPSGSS
jgi:polysaccharide export outer membrane protein